MDAGFDLHTNFSPQKVYELAKMDCAVLISEDDWLAIQETLYLNSMPGMTESILESRNEDISECTSYNPDELW